MCKDHYEGFERERKFNLVANQAYCDCPVLKARTVKKIIAHFAPEFLNGLFESRPCVRNLRYIGCGCEETVCSHGPKFFRLGEIYQLIEFNGATYTITGYDDGNARIGSAYFEWIE
jgi:hypothetical protein